MLAQPKAQPTAPMQIAPICWYDGALVDQSSVAVHPFAHGLHYGTGVFEGIRAYETPRGPGIFRLHDHMARLARSAEFYGLDIPHSVDAMCAHVADTVRANGWASVYIRPLAFFGEATFTLQPIFKNSPTHVLIALRSLGGYFGERHQGIKTTVSKWRKFSSAALPATAKGCGHYTNSVLALQDAVSRGFEEAILLNDRGEVAEGSGENVFVVKDGIVHTNDSSADALDGITRASVLSLASDLGIPTQIHPLTVQDLRAADEFFVTGTAAEVTPVSVLDEHQYAADHPITDALAAAYMSAVRGDDARHPDWVTFVE